MANEAPVRPGAADPDKKNPPVVGPDAVAAVAAEDPEKVHPRTVQDATDWFFSEESQQQDTVAKAIVPINVASAGQPKRWQDFTLQVLDRDRIREIREGCMKKNADGVREVDDVEANLRMVAEAMLVPDLKGAIAAGQTVRGQAFMDPADMLTARFAHKPGVIDLLATKLTEISGYNSDDVLEVKAAGKLIRAGGQATLLFYAWYFGNEDPWALYHVGRPRPRAEESSRRATWRDVGWVRDRQRPADGPGVYTKDDPPPCPHPRRMKYFTYAMAAAAFDMTKRLHGVHEDQQEGRKKAAPKGAEMRMPGGVVGTKTIPGRQ